MLSLFTRLSIAFLLLLSVPTEANLNGTNSTSPDSEKVVCVYPLSGQYGMLPRLLYYGLLVFSVLAHRQVWLIAGAMASAMTYSGTAAIHSTILAFSSRNWIFDLDAFGTWAVVSTGCLAVIPVLDWSYLLVDSQFRPVFGFWGFLMALGSSCASVPLYRRHAPEPACRSSDQVLLASPRQLEHSAFNCTYTCFSARQVLRDPSEITIIPSEQVNGTPLVLMKAALGMVITGSCLLGGFGCCLTTRKRTEAELRACIEQKKVRRLDVMLRGGWTTKKALRLAQKELETGKLQMPRSMWAYVNPALFPIVLVLNEICLVGYGGLPSNEEPYSVGQWAPLVGVALALIAAGILRYKEPQWRERQAILAAERAAFELRTREESEIGLRNEEQISVNHAEKDQPEIQPYRSNSTNVVPSPGHSSPSSAPPCSGQAQRGSENTASDKAARTRPNWIRGFLHIFPRRPTRLTSLSWSRTMSWPRRNGGSKDTVIKQPAG